MGNESQVERGFEGWAIVELFGHSMIAGMASEQSIAGSNMLRVDVPEVDGSPAFTKFFGSGAIYAITPTTEENARIAAGRLGILARCRLGGARNASNWGSRRRIRWNFSSKVDHEASFRLARRTNFERNAHRGRQMI